MEKIQEYHVYAHDGRGLYAGMRNFTAISEEDAISQGKRTFTDIPRCCTKWVATRERAHINAGRKLARQR